MSYQFKATHHGRMYGVPVWLDMSNDDCPAVEPKYGWLGEAAWQTMNFLFGCFTWTATMINPEYEPMFVIHMGEPV